MIDCLSDPAWINPQTNVLIFLQGFRCGFLENFDKFFLSITIFGEFWLPTVLCAITYWCIDSAAGMYLFGLEGFNILLAHLFKMLACVYRPWVLDSNIKPSELAVPFAKGYSFPSGHSAMSSSVLGGIAYLIRKNKILCTLLILLVLMIGFSRLWLGVHTPQDVAGGFLIGLILIFTVNRIINWAENDKNRYIYLAITVNIFAILALIYIHFFNSCRIDYINGELLVDPRNSIYVTTVVYAFALGLINGAFFCRRFFPFNPKEASVKNRITRGIIGACGTILLLKLVLGYVVMNTLYIWTAISIMFTMGIFITLIYPIIFSKIEKSFSK